MQREIKLQSVRERMPVSYRYNVISRTFMLFFASFISLYTIYFLVTRVTAETPMFFKILPMIILYISLDSVFRHVTSLNQVIFTAECLWLRFILKPSVPIPWDDIESMQLRKQITYYLHLGYKDIKGRKRMFKVNAAYPKMLEIIYNIADLSPNVVMNDELVKMISYLKEISKSEADKQE